MTRAPLFNTSRIYAITPDEADTTRLLAKVEAVLAGGVGMLQYRNKLADATLRKTQAAAVLALCRQFQTLFVINDYLDLCETLDADGVHLGGTDGDIAAARAKLGNNKIIGASCYNRLDLAQQAQQAGADYAAFGACFSSDTKPNAVHVPLDLFTQAKAQLHIPLVAIGGITLQNVHLLKNADAVAVINALFGADNITKATQQFNCLFQPFER